MGSMAETLILVDGEGTRRIRFLLYQPQSLGSKQMILSGCVNVVFLNENGNFSSMVVQLPLND